MASAGKLGAQHSAGRIPRALVGPARARARVAAGGLAAGHGLRRPRTLVTSPVRGDIRHLIRLPGDGWMHFVAAADGGILPAADGVVDRPRLRLRCARHRRHRRLVVGAGPAAGAAGHHRPGCKRSDGGGGARLALMVGGGRADRRQRHSVCLARVLAPARVHEAGRVPTARRASARPRLGVGCSGAGRS